MTREEGQSQRLAAAFWSVPVKGEEDQKWFPASQKQRLPAALRTTNSRIDGSVDMLEKKLSSTVSRAGFCNEEQTTCEDAVEEGCTPSAGSTSLQLNGLLSSYQTQLHPEILDFHTRRGKIISVEKPENAAQHILGKMKSESEIEEDDGSVFAEDMDIRDSDSDSFYWGGLHSTDDEMDDYIFLDLDKESDKEDDSSEELMEEDDSETEGYARSAGGTCFRLNEPPPFEAFLHPEECERIKKQSEEKVDILGDEDVVQVERGIVSHWAYADFTNLSQRLSRRLVTTVVDTCATIGMKFTPSPIMEAQAAPADIERTLVDLDQMINDHLTKCGRKEEQLGLLLVILPDETCYYDEVERVCKKLGITYHHCYDWEATYPSKGHLKRIARAIQSKVVMRDARLRRLALPLVAEAPMLIFGADIFRCTPGDEGSDYISSVATSLDWPKFRRYTVQLSHDEGAINVSARLGYMITEFIYSFTKIKKKTVEKIIFFSHLRVPEQSPPFIFCPVESDMLTQPHLAQKWVKGWSIYNFCHQEMSAIKMSCAYIMDGYEPCVTYVVVLPHEKMELTNKSGPTGAYMTGYKFWWQGKGNSTLVCYHVVHDENNFPHGELQFLTSKLCSIHDRRAYPEIDTVPQAFYARHNGMAAFEEWRRIKQLTKFQSN